MCIIVAKPANTKMPSQEIISRCFYRNPDGAGFMYSKNGKVRIRKGFMTLSDFNKALEELSTQINMTATPIVMHFRIGTAGGNIPQNTHPYPVNDNLKLLQSLNTKTDLGVVHNGIIDIRPRQKDINDTMEYIMSQLAPLKRAVPNFYENADLVQMIKNAITSKMAFLTTDGRIYTIGEFTEEDGILYSNDTYKPYSTKYLGTYWSSPKGVSGWDYSYDWDDEDYWSSYLSKRASKDENRIIPIDMMWLEEGEIVRNRSGELLDAETYCLLLDEDDEVWTYNVEEDVAVYLGGTAYDENLKLLHFDPERSNKEYVHENDIAKRPVKKEGSNWILHSDK